MAIPENHGLDKGKLVLPDTLKPFWLAGEHDRNVTWRYTGKLKGPPRSRLQRALMRVRSSQRRLTLVSSDSPEEEKMSDPIEVPGPERQAASRETAAILEHALDSIPEFYRTVFVLREVEQLDTAETAAVLGVGDDVVKTRLHRARTALREQLLAMVGGTARDAFDFQAPRCDRVVHAVLARLASGR